jgi:pimeloyl-ACP methyl ester carboxylesterase
VPTLVLCGKEDALTPPEHSEEMAAGIGDKAELKIIEGSGHLLPLEQPKKTNDILKNWLA